MTKKIVLLIHLFIFIALCCLAIFTHGTGGGGDSLAHYFISQNSWYDTFSMFRHWGKPFFVFFSSPFAQFGFVGIKIFNALCGTLASYITYLVAEKLNKNNSWYIPILAFTAPGLYVYLMSGLTEPFSALVCISSVYLLLNNKTAWGLILASFLPFCRSEAQLFLFLFAGYAILNNKWKYLPLLVTGYVTYSIIGRLVYFDSFMWIFDIPYKAGKSPYGSGPWFHYIVRLLYMLATPAYILMGLGFIKMGIRVFKEKNFWKTELVLVHFMAIGLITAHSIVWALGVYASAGLERVMVVIFPFLWLIMLDGFNLLKEILAKVYKPLAFALPALFFIGQFVFISRHPVSNYYKNIATKLSVEDNFLRDTVAPYIKDNYPTVNCFVLEKPYLAIELGFNPMNRAIRGDWNIVNSDTMKLPQNEALFIWDDKYPNTQYGASLEKVRSHPQLREVKEFNTENGWKFIIFEFIPIEEFSKI